MHKGATLRNSDRVLGLVVYTGVDTKLALNLSKYRFKMSQLEKNTNLTIGGNLVIMLTFSVVLAFCNYFFASSHLNHTYMLDDVNPTTLSLHSFFSFWLILNALIPLELPVCMEIAKFVVTTLMEQDTQMMRVNTHTKSVDGLRCNTLNLHEELGEISYLFCDKTGTLTQNELVFNSLSIVSNE